MPHTYTIVEDQVKRIKATLKNLPKIVGNEVVNFTLDRFKAQAWVAPWPKRKIKSAWGAPPRNNGRNVLIDRGRLRRATRVVKADWGEIVIGNDTPYAKVHNDGFSGLITQKVKMHVRKNSGRNKFATIKAAGAKRGSTKRIASGLSYVKAHSRTIKQNIPQRRYLGAHPLLMRRLKSVSSNYISKNF